MLKELELPSPGPRCEQSSLTFFYKIHSGTVSLNKDRSLTPVIDQHKQAHQNQTVHSIVGTKLIVMP